MTDAARAIARICDDLSLPTGDSKDWECELSSEYRSYDYFSRYVAAYSREDYEHEEKLALMSLMLDITNEFLEDDAIAGHGAWDVLAALLEENFELHRHQLEYWARADFCVTPLVHKFLNDARSAVA